MNKVIDKGFRSCRFVSTIVKHPVCQGPVSFPGSLYVSFGLSVLILESCEQRYFVDLEGLFVCHHQQKVQSCSLVCEDFMLLIVNDVWFTVVLFHTSVTLPTFACEAEGCGFSLSKGVTVEGCLCAQRCFISPQSFVQLVSVYRNCQGQGD